MSLSHTRASTTVVVTAAVLAATLGPPALADASEAKERFEKGVALFKDADYEGALVEFEAAYEVQPNFKVKYNIGISLFKLHRYVEAKAELQAYLSLGGDGISEEERLQVQGMLYEMQSLIGSITVTCNVQGASVTVDGDDAGPCPFVEPLAVDLGEYVVEVVAAGHEKFRQTVTVAGGKAIVVNATLEADPTAGGFPSPPPGGPPPGKGLLNVQMSPGSRLPWPHEVIVDGVSVGVTPVLALEVDPGEHKVAVLGSTKSSESHYETVKVGVGETVTVSARLKPLKSYNAIIFGATWTIAGIVGTAIGGAIYAGTDPSNSDKRDISLVMTISLASIAGIGMIVGGVGLGLYVPWRKKDARLKEEYLSSGGDTLALSPFVAPVEGGGMLGLAGAF